MIRRGLIVAASVVAGLLLGSILYLSAYASAPRVVVNPERIDDRLPAWVYQYAIDVCRHDVLALEPRFGISLRAAIRQVGLGPMNEYLKAEIPNCYRVSYLGRASLGVLDQFIFVLDHERGQSWMVLVVKDDTVEDIR